VRTVFNILGPLTNPALVEAQVMGVASENLGEKMIQVLQCLGTRRAFVVHGLNGMDEITVAGKSRVWELGDGEITQFDIAPGDFGVNESGIKTLAGGTAEENAIMLRSVLEGNKGARRNAVVMNAAAGIALNSANKGLPALKAAAALAREAIDSGKARGKLESLIRTSQSYG
jgi:anthranilate phosphoribosyltransferase